MMYYKGREIRDDAESITEAFIYMVIVAVVTRNIIGLLLYRGNYYLPFFNIELNKVQSWSLYLVLVGINAFFSLVVLNVERTSISSLNYGLIPAVISIVVFYMQTYTLSVLIFMIITITLCISSTYKYIKRWKYAKNKGKRLRKLKVFRKYYRRSFGHFSYMSTLIIIYCIIGIFLFDSFDGSRVKVATVKAMTYDDVPSDDGLYTLLDANKDVLITLKDGVYQQATEQERINALQTLLNVECTYFKIPAIKLVCKKLPSYKAGYYSAADGTAYIMEEYIKDSKYIEDNFDVIETVIHEGRHHYQHECVNYAIQNNYDLDLSVNVTLRDWKNNIENYYEIKKDDESVEEWLCYRTQPIESDANQFGYDYALIITSYINEW